LSGPRSQTTCSRPSRTTIEQEADFLEEYLLPVQRASEESADELEAFIEDGRALRDQLAAVIDRDLDARAVDRRLMVDWHKRAKALVTSYKVAAHRQHQARGG
jgi:hypothetical protein